MKPSVIPFTAVYTQWLDSFRALLPGSMPPGSSQAINHSREQAAANQEWEHEGGSIRPASTPGAKDAPKLPL
jgi:hypothetical protein